MRRFYLNWTVYKKSKEMRHHLSPTNLYYAQVFRILIFYPLFLIKEEYSESLCVIQICLTLNGVSFLLLCIMKAVRTDFVSDLSLECR